MEVLRRPDAKKIIGAFEWQTEELCAALWTKEPLETGEKGVAFDGCSASLMDFDLIFG